MAASNRLPSTLFSPPAAGKPASDDANSGGSSSRDARKYCGVDLRVYLELKNVIHHYLFNKVDLERIAAAPDEGTRAQVFAVIQDAVSRLKAPLSGPDKEQLSLEILEETKITFKDDAHLMRLIHKIVSAIGRRVDESSPMVDARLADGSRIHVIIPPLAIDGPHLSIRRFGPPPIPDDA